MHFMLWASLAVQASAPVDTAFDWFVPPGETLVLDTTQAVISDPNGNTMVVTGGVIRVRHVTLSADSLVKVVGPNPLMIFARGTVQIDGHLRCDGNDNPGVLTLNTLDQPEPGASGNGGGGRGGTGSYLTTEATPRGGDGFGAFDVPEHGGGGGESAFLNGATADRRPGGGGGGVFGPTQPKDHGLSLGICPNQNFIGLDPENGFDGYPIAIGAISMMSPPRGGFTGRSPFVDPFPDNDFFGKKITNVDPDDPTAPMASVTGELPHPWAGAGGGAGGDSHRSPVWPPDPLDPNLSDKGAGGGGGGGSITVTAGGDIVIGPFGLITANGGTGGGGENTIGLNRIGGGSGGGSGGHVILQTASRIDLSQIQVPRTVTGERRPNARIQAMGGQGGAGQSDHGGATAGGNQTSPCLDSIHMPGPYGPCPHLDYDGNDPLSSSSCPAANDPVPFSNITCAGGDGGPGIVQFHVLSLDAIIGPENDISLLRWVVYPHPVGYVTRPDTQLPRFFDRLVPDFDISVPASLHASAPGSPSRTGPGIERLVMPRRY